MVLKLVYGVMAVAAGSLAEGGLLDESLRPKEIGLGDPEFSFDS